MNVLVCDDDRATRFVVNRILTQHFGMRVTECGNGLEALRTLAQGEFQFMLLDIEMPGMSGIEVLELMRASKRTKDLPVVMLTNVRDGDAVKYLMQLGVSDYLLKPPKNDKLIEKIQRLLRVLPRAQETETDGSAIRISPGSPALVVEGDRAFRDLLVRELESYGPVRVADSGVAAVSQFREGPVGLVFVGDDLGVIGPELLVRKLRDMQPDGRLRMVGVVEDVAHVPPGVFDAVMKRTRLPLMLRGALKPFVRAEETMSGLADLAPNLPEITAAAASQVLAMMFDGDVTASEPCSLLNAAADAAAAVEIADRFVVTIGVLVEEPAAPALAQRLLGAADAEATRSREPVAAELTRLVAGRLHAVLRERGVQSVDSPPRPFAQSAEPADSSDTTTRLTIGGVGDVVLNLSVHDRLGQPKEEDVAAEAVSPGV